MIDGIPYAAPPSCQHSADCPHARQMSILQVDGSQLIDVGDIKVNNYHGYFAFNASDADAPVRPYVFGGLGAAQSRRSAVHTARRRRERNDPRRHAVLYDLGRWREVLPEPGRWLRLGVEFTPTYISSDARGYWCDPYSTGRFNVKTARALSRTRELSQLSVTPRTRHQSSEKDLENRQRFFPSFANGFEVETDVARPSGPGIAFAPIFR